MKIIIPTSIAPKVEPEIRRIAPDWAIVHIDSEGHTDGDISDAVVFFRWWMPTRFVRQVVKSSPNLRWMHTAGAGVENLLAIKELVESNIILTNASGAQAVPIAEFVMMFILHHSKRVPQLMALKPETFWSFEDRDELDELTGKTLLILGMGAIGKEIARRAHAFDMRVIGSRRTDEALPNVDQIVVGDTWRDMLPQADYVVIATPLTATTRAMFNADAFARMRQTAFLINIARGAILDQDALAAALTNGQIAGAALDVTEPEPLPPDHALWKAPGLWITPHISYSSPQTSQRMLRVFFENLERFVDRRPLHNIIDKVAGY